MLTSDALTTVYNSGAHNEIATFHVKGEIGVTTSIDFCITMSSGEYNVIQLNETPFTAGILGRELCDGKLYRYDNVVK